MVSIFFYWLFLSDYECFSVTSSPVLSPLTINFPHHIETSQLICMANQWTGFHVMGKNWSLIGR